jgi:copper chaperone CopZ
MAVETLNLPIQGMTSGECARKVERQLTSTPGVTKAAVDLKRARAIVDYDADLVKPEALANVVRQLGYGVPALS